MSYSHPATKQDEWVLKNCGKEGTFMELGAYDGVKHSNTLLLEQMGWTGVLIEAVHEFADLCRQNRRCQVINACIGNNARNQPFYIGGQYSGLVATMPYEFVEGHVERKNETIWVDPVPLSVVGPKSVTYFSLDTEGGEYHILKEWFEAGGDCQALTVEFRYNDHEFARLERLCDDYNMYLDEVRGFDLCFLEK